MSVQSEHDIFSFRANYAFAKWKAANIEDAKRSDNYKKSFDELRYVLQSHVTVPSKAHPVCIIGAGPAGLYTAMILQSLGIPYRLLEASGRVGGEPACCVSRHDCLIQTSARPFVDTPVRSSRRRVS
jgi:heterodisulfide reductase subunit A-like polyferredoxin